MSGLDFAIAAFAATMGGAIGAAGTAFLTWTQFQDSLDTLGKELELFMKNPGSDPAPLREALQAFRRDAGVLGAALARLRRLLRIR